MTDQPLKTWMSWSSGKDSALALHRLRQDPDYDVTHLLTTVTAPFDRVAMHAVRRPLLRAQADAQGLSLFEIELPYPCSNEDYERIMSSVIDEAEQSGVRKMAFGDLFLEDIRQYRVDMLAPTSLDPVFPLWLERTDDLAHHMIECGIKAILTCVDPSKLPKSFVGRTFDRDLLNDLPEGIDPCGENGEFHTFVYDSPEFKRPIPIKVGEIVERDGFVFADIEPD